MTRGRLTGPLTPNVMHRKKKILTITAVIFIVAVSYYRYNSLDGIKGNILSLLFWPNTEYAEGYSDTGYRKIQPGFTQEQVIDILGEPFYANEDWNSRSQNEIRWWYSRSLRNTHYRMREVRFVDGTVSRKVHYFYVD